ncbi:histidine triad nucleotide-binding 3-like [Brachionus plicatilis]|uniref:Adenosine 5'-monophosphoramidase HINT3 n=1 Tax=Brachionus plicatilis TaxID=10195 RepID=A0A3M7SJ55_BRAPC|nr:histidine triad nucleotide-binding 3-like [Brachionus plicatilis]RNA35569.1 histidine triad nucleotide-binding 3-like [Brachionus plicatilis]
MSESKCVFCRIINKIDKEADILHEDDEIIIIKDKFPVSENHILVLPKEHITNAKYLSANHLNLVEKMNEAGINKMKELNADLNDLRSGFNWPPLNTINHLHQHFISPSSNMSLIRKIIFSHKNFFFVDAAYILKRLRR